MKNPTRAAKPKKLATKLSRYILVSILVVFFILILFIGYTTKQDLTGREQEKLTLLATENANTAKQFMEDMIIKQEVLLVTIKNMKDADDTIKMRLLQNIITETKANEENALSLFLVTRPNAIIQNAPNGYSIFATDNGTVVQADMYAHINKELLDQAVEGKTMTILDPFNKTIDGKEYMVLTILLPILDANGEVQGIVGSNIDTAFLNNVDYNKGGYGSFRSQIICGHQTIIMNSVHPDRIGKKYIDATDSINAQAILASAKDPVPFNLMDTHTDGSKFYKAFAPFYIQGSSVVWLSESGISNKEFNDTILQQIVQLIIILVISLIALAFLIFIRIKKSLKPIITLDNAAKELSQGNLHVQIDYHSNDELGSLAQSLRDSISILYTYVSDIDCAMAKMASGNFDVTPSVPFIGDFKNIEDSITKFVIIISKTLAQISASADQVSESSEQVSDGAQELSQSATEQASYVEELSASVNVILDQIKNNAENAAAANNYAVNAGTGLTTCNSKMDEMIHAMNEISHSSSEISKIIKTIEDIAFQTNILALNAAVEAARAGSAGKGFAVVADEVRNLATKSSEAAKHTHSLIENSVISVENGVKIANDTAQSLLDVVKSSEEMITLNSKISEASSEQATEIIQINTGVEQISSVVQTTSATAEESAAVSEELRGQAKIMNEMVSQFTIKK